MRRLPMLLFLLSGCASDASTLRVDLRTDYAPVLEAPGVRTRIWRDEARERLLHEEMRTIPIGSVAFEGMRIAEVEVATSMVWVDVELIAGDGLAFAQRVVAVRVSGDTGVTALITRNCEGVSCPASDPNASQCLGGRCVDPECSPERPDLCPDPVCAGASECPSGAACSEPACVAGACVLRPRDDECAPGSQCDPDDGCRGVDAGPLDAGPTDAGFDSAADAGADAGSDAGSDTGTDTGEACADVCPGPCVAGTCQITDPLAFATCPAGFPCRITCATAGACLAGVSCGMASSCRVRCDSALSCPTLDCPTGSCNIECNGDNSCASVTCNGDECRATCDGAGSCASFTCSGDCELDCGAGACGGELDCSSACRCEISCAGGVCTPAAICPPACQDGTQCRDMSACNMCP